MTFKTAKAKKSAANEEAAASWIQVSDRIQSLPPYLFLEIDRAKRAARERGADLIDFGIGDPDTPTPPFIIKALFKALKDPATHKYPLDYGNPVFRKAVAAWYETRFSVKLDPDREILPLIGSKEGLAHIPLAFVNPGDKVLIPEPAYPAYRSGVLFAGGEPVTLPLKRENRFLPDWAELETAMDLSKVKMVYLNYPNNPTSATADLEFFERTVEFGKKHKIIICHDNAYSEIYDGRKTPSFLEVKGAKSVGVEFHSLSKTFNMTGWRVGFVCGNAEIIAGLAKVKSNVDSGVFSAIQLAGVEALKQAGKFTRQMNVVYSKRRKALVAGLKALGFDVFASDATFYVWCRVPKKGMGSMEFSKLLLEKASIVATPGNGFGALGEGYVRFTLTVPEIRIQEALKRLKKVLS